MNHRDENKYGRGDYRSIEFRAQSQEGPIEGTLSLSFKGDYVTGNFSGEGINGGETVSAKGRDVICSDEDQVCAEPVLGKTWETVQSSKDIIVYTAEKSGDPKGTGGKEGRPNPDSGLPVSIAFTIRWEGRMRKKVNVRLIYEDQLVSGEFSSSEIKGLRGKDKVKADGKSIMQSDWFVGPGHEETKVRLAPTCGRTWAEVGDLCLFLVLYPNEQVEMES